MVSYDTCTFIMNRLHIFREAIESLDLEPEQVQSITDIAEAVDQDTTEQAEQTEQAEDESIREDKATCKYLFNQIDTDFSRFMVNGRYNGYGMLLPGLPRIAEHLIAVANQLGELVPEDVTSCLLELPRIIYSLERSRSSHANASRHNDEWAISPYKPQNYALSMSNAILEINRCLQRQAIPCLDTIREWIEGL